MASDTNDTYLVWIDNELLLDPQAVALGAGGGFVRTSNEDFDTVSLMFDLEEVARFPDGGIYLFK